MNTIIAFICMFGLLVFVHEWGHLIFAKRAGMLAREFAIGFGPKIFSFTRNETLYTIRLIPAGGYVRVAGDDPEIIELKPGHHVGITYNDQGKVNQIIVNNKDKHPDARVIEVDKVDLDHELIIEGYDVGEHEEKHVFEVDEKAFFIVDEVETQIAPYNRQFASKSVGQRAMQLFAGPMMNFFLAIILFIIIGIVQGVPAERALLSDVVDGSPAEEAGIQNSDEIVEIEGTPISTWEGFTTIVRNNPDTPLDMVVDRDGEKFTVEVTPNGVPDVLDESVTVGQIGVYQGFEKSVMGTLTYGFTETYETTTMIVSNLVKLITGQYSIDMLAGPVGIYDATDQIVQTGFMNFLMWTAMLSVNLGIINLVPLPALDGGRLMFVLIEAIRGKPMDPQKEGIVHFIGFALIMLLMITVTWNDIQRLFM